MGEEEFDGGEITKARNCVCGYFSQDVGAMSGRSALQEVMSASAALMELGRQIREMEAAIRIDSNFVSGYRLLGYF